MGSLKGPMEREICVGWKAAVKLEAEEEELRGLVCEEELDTSIQPEWRENEEVRDVEGIWKPKHKEYLCQLQSNELNYNQDFYPLYSNQHFISPNMRAILFDWMKEVLSEFTMKRETFHMAVSHVDRFLAINPQVPRDKFQLVGLASMYISCKAEEIFVPKIQDFVKSADNAYTCEEIKFMEKKMLQSLLWKIYPPTKYNFLSCLMSEWDSYLVSQYSQFSMNSPDHFAHLPQEQKRQCQIELDKRLITFKQPNQYSYKRYRDAMELLDIALLNWEVNSISHSRFAAAVLYASVTRGFYLSNYELLRWGGEADPQELQMYLGEVVHSLLHSCLCATLGLTSLDLLTPALNILHPFLEIPCDYALPPAARYLRREDLEVTFT